MHVDLVQAERSFLRLIGILSIKVSNDDYDDYDDYDDDDDDDDYRCGGSIITSFYLVVNVVDINERCRSLHMITVKLTPILIIAGGRLCLRLSEVGHTFQCKSTYYRRC